MLDASDPGSRDRISRTHDAAVVSWEADSSGEARVPDADTPEIERSLDALVQRLVKCGDVPTALGHIMRTCQDDIYKLCCRLLADNVLAEDVCQQIFMDVLRDLPRFQHRSSVRSWLFAIAHHRIYDALKARRRVQARISPGDLADELADEPDPRPSPAESAGARQLRDALMASFGELREPVRVAVMLRFQQGFTFEEIAAMCGATPGTHHARVSRALRQLRAGIESRIQDRDQLGGRAAKVDPAKRVDPAARSRSRQPQLPR